MPDSDFFAVPRTKVETSDGSVEMPMFFYDVSVVQAFFWCELERAEPLLAGTNFVPTKFRGGKALVGMIFFEYRDTSIGPYNEAGIVIAAHPAHARRPLLPTTQFLRKAADRTMGIYVTDLPVTTQAACGAGREIWGFPKFITDIPFKLDVARFECGVTDPDTGGALCSLAGPVGRGPRLPMLDLVVYLNHEGAMLKAIVDVKAKAVTNRGQGIRLQVGSGDHRMVRNLRDLGLDGATPVAIQTTDRFQSRLHFGEKIGSCHAPPLPYGDDH